MNLEEIKKIADMFDNPKYQAVRVKNSGTVMIGGDIMIGSNEDFWRKYQEEPAKGLKKARLVQSGIDPNESFNTFRGAGIVIGTLIILYGFIAWLAL